MKENIMCNRIYEESKSFNFKVKYILLPKGCYFSIIVEIIKYRYMICLYNGKKKLLFYY